MGLPEPKNLITIEYEDGSIRSQFVTSEQIAASFIDFLRDLQEEGDSVHEVFLQKNGTS